jgi:hypothetical protein
MHHVYLVLNLMTMAFHVQFWEPKCNLHQNLELNLGWNLHKNLESRWVYTRVILISYKGMYITIDAQSFIFGGCALYAIFSFTLVQGRWDDT